MTSQRTLSICFALLAWLGTLLLGMGKADTSLPLLMFTVVVTAIYFTDIKQWFWLNRKAASVGALIAAAMASSDFFGMGSEQLLVAIANLLVYLQIVLLYQRKTTRVYWQLLMMSLLQVVVAAVINLTVLFGLVLLIYLAFLVTTLVLFFLSREMERFPATAVGALAPHHVSHRSGEGLPNKSIGFMAIGSGQVPGRPFDHSLWRTIAAMLLTTVTITGIVFFAVPRFGKTPWGGQGVTSRRVVGFSHRVGLDDLGEVFEDPELVMRVQFVHRGTGEPFQVTGGLWIRGSVVTHYSTKDKQWYQTDWSHQEKPLVKLPAAGSEPIMVDQQITLEPLNEPVLFSVYPPYRIGDQPGVRYDRNRQQLIRLGNLRRAQMNLHIGTLGFRGRRQIRVTPQDKPLRGAQDAKLLQFPRPPRSGPHPLSGLAQTARDVLRVANVTREDRYAAAMAIESFLAESGRFRYSLDPLPPGARRRDLDPNEDFVTRVRQGHCEYFASALTLMLRSQRIPARMVIGFRDGEWNSFGNFYQFQQLHAHTWVEVYLEPKDLLGHRTDLDVVGVHGGWLRLDPTPASDGQRYASRGRFFSGFREAWSYAGLLWANYVVGLTYEKQQRSIYTPLRTTVVDVAKALVDAQRRRETLRKLYLAVRDGLWTWLRGNWFSWRGGLVAIGVCLILVGFYFAMRSVWRWLSRWSWRRIETARTRRHLEVRFYSRLEQLLRHYGMTRMPGETPGELAAVAGGQLATMPDGQTVARLPHELVEAFYRVRFGRVELQRKELEAVERALTELEHALRMQRGRA
ncbi:MAG: DUF3488 and DUF4129 domain-containing transglutaminase family protein [Pirellulales bacterium]